MTILKQLTQFIQNHWALCSMFGAVLILILFEELRNAISGIPKISPQNTILLLNHENAVIFDLRKQEIFADGHITGSINILPTDLESNLKKIESYKNKPIILVNDANTNTVSIGTKLQKIGFIKIYALAGGIQAWKTASLPLTK
jgi:rhodanese-related sulfurtransferase